MAQDISDIKKKVDKIDEKFDVLIDKLEAKFAAKWTEVAIRRFV